MKSSFLKGKNNLNFIEIKSSLPKEDFFHFKILNLPKILNY